MLRLDTTKVKDSYIQDHNINTMYLTPQYEQQIATQMQTIDLDTQKNSNVDRRIIQLQQQAEQSYLDLETQKGQDRIKSEKQKNLQLILQKNDKSQPIKEDLSQYQKTVRDQPVQVDFSRDQIHTFHSKFVTPYTKQQQPIPPQKQISQTKVKYEKSNIPQEININQLLLDSKQFLYKNKLEKAEEKLESAYKYGVRHSDVFYLLGETKRQLTKYKEAELYLMKCLQFEVHSHFVYKALALTYIELEDYELAIPLFNAFIEYVKENEQIYFDLGKCYMKKNQNLEAAQAFTKAIEIKPQNGIYFLHRAEAYENLGFAEIAKKDYKIFKQLNPNYIQKYEQQARNLEKNQQYVQARDVRKFIQKLAY